MSVLSTLIPNYTKVKEILKEQSLELDGIKDKYLFGQKFEEKLSKITTAKQKSKKYLLDSRKVQHQHSLLTTSPFEKALYPKTTNDEHQRVEGAKVRCSKEQLLEEVRAIPAKLHQKVEILSSKIFSQIHPLIKTPIKKYHYYQNPLNFLPSNKTGRKDSCRSGDRKNVGKTSNRINTTLKRPVSEYNFPSYQKRHRTPSSTQFKKVESVHPIQTIQNERSISFEKNSPEE